PAEGLAMKILSLTTRGLGDLGHGPDAVYQRPAADGLRMPFASDVFRHAVQTMSSISSSLLSAAGLPISAIRFFVPHQANQRITDAVAERLGCSESQVISTVGSYGNTGSAAVILALATVARRLERNEYVLVVVFGGGYSSGAMLLQYS